MLLQMTYEKDGEKHVYAHVSYLKKLKESKYADLKALIKIAIGDRTQKNFAEGAGISREYLSRMLNENNTKVPSIRMLRTIAELSANKEIASYKNLLIAAGHTPACEKDNEKNDPSLITLDKVPSNHAYELKKQLIEALILVRKDTFSTEMSVTEYISNFMSNFISENLYSFFDFTCNINIGNYAQIEDYGVDTVSYDKRRLSDKVVIGYVKSSVRTAFEPDVWASARVYFAFYFKEENGQHTITDTDWDIPEYVISELDYEPIGVRNTYSMADFLEEVSETKYYLEEIRGE